MYATHDIFGYSSYECFVLRAMRLSSKLLKQWYLVERLKSSFRKFYCRYEHLIQHFEVSLSRMLNDILTLDQQWLPNRSDFQPISWPWYRAWPSPNYEWLYVYCISFIARHFLLWKLTGAKSNFESMFQQKRSHNQYTEYNRKWNIYFTEVEMIRVEYFKIETS